MQNINISKQKISGATIPKGEDLIRYIFENVFSSYGYAVRVQQIDLSQKMFRALKERGILMSDVAIGFGKTHAYLVAGIVYHLETAFNNKPVIISTSGKELQRAIVEEYLPDISRMLLQYGVIDKLIPAVLRKGKYNYICYNRLTTYIDRLNVEKKNTRQYTALRRIKEDKEIDLDKAYGISRYDRNRICIHETVCRECNGFYCPYKMFLRKVFEEDYIFQICNHNYYTMDAMHKTMNRKPLLPEYKAVIIDEAHKLDQAAVQSYSTAIDFQQIESCIKNRNIKKAGIKSNKIISNLCKDIENSCEEIKKALFEQITFNKGTLKHNVMITSGIRSKLLHLRDSLILANRTLEQIKSFSTRQLLYTAKSIGRFFETDCITYIEKINKKYVLVGVPKHISTLTKRDLFSGSHGIVMTSGTMAIDHDFEYVKRLLGLDITARKISYVVKDSPFNYMDNSLIYTSHRMIYPNYKNELYIKALANEIDKLIRASYGHSLVLFTSYTVMRAVYEMLRKREYHFPIFKTNKSGGYAVMQFKENKNAVLFGCGSLWEGMNFEGDRLSHLIITKLPFLVPDPITENKRLELGSDAAYRRQMLIPQMLLKLKQGHGRAIRTITDTAVISILDCRVNTHYKRPVLDALPRCKVISDIEVVKQFFRDKKPDEYFRRFEDVRSN